MLSPQTKSSNFRIEINAGKCIYDGNMLKPDKRKGKLVLYKAYDNLCHVQWISRENNKVEDDLIIIDDAYLKRIEECKTGRVYMLNFIYSGKKLYFWMQDADESKDDAFVNEFNRVTGCLPSVGDVQKKLSSSVNIEELSQSIISQIRNVQRGEVERSRNKEVGFSELIRIEYFKDLLEIPEAVEELKKHMPEKYQTKEDVLDVIKNRFLDGSLKFLDISLKSHFNFLLSSLNIPIPEKDVADPMEYIVDNLEKKYEQEENN